jgi:predicted dehydrogenase
MHHPSRKKPRLWRQEYKLDRHHLTVPVARGEESPANSPIFSDLSCPYKAPTRHNRHHPHAPDIAEPHTMAEVVERREENGMTARLRVGVIGLGRRWSRYRNAVTDLTAIRALCDPSVAHAEREAAALGCSSAGGVVELLECDLDAVLLLDPGWTGLWPLEPAVRSGKHVLCTTVPSNEYDHIPSLCEQLSDTGPRVVVALVPRLWRLVRRIGILLEQRLGRILLLRLHWTGSSLGEHQPILAAPLMLPLLLACRELLGMDPDEIRTTTLSDAPNHAAMVLGFGEGRMAELSVWRGPAARHSCRLEFIAEYGSGVAELPDEIRWTDGEGRHHFRLPSAPPEREILEHFVACARGQTEPGPTLLDVQVALDWLRRARVVAP